MNNNLNYDAISKGIIDKIVEYVANSATLEFNLEQAKEEAIQKSVKVQLPGLLRSQFEDDPEGAEELSRALGVSLDGFTESQVELIRKISRLACEELRLRIKAPVVSECVATEPITGEKAYTVLLD